MESTNTRIVNGRIITTEDIRMIHWVLDSYKGLSRSEMILTICEVLGWSKSEDGRITPRQCQEFLLTLESEGVIVLPEGRKMKVGPISFLEVLPQYETITEKGIIELRRPSGVKENKLWRSYVEEYHPLKHRKENGPNIKYFIMHEEKELGCIQFSSAAWALEDRENWIGWDKGTKDRNLRLILNNTRYLILPWAKIPYLASKALGKVTKHIQNDWLNTYGYEPALLETFVDSTLYTGTCYKAANWIEIGITKGRGNKDRNKEYGLTKKLIFVYPLQKDFREVLQGKKPYRRIEI
jgi:hypothetical protein